MKKLALGLLASLSLLNPALAATVTYDYTVTLQQVFETDLNTSVGGLVAQSVLPGAPVAAGQTIHGRFSFDTSTPVVLVPPGDNGSHVLYSDDGARNTLVAEFDQTGLVLATPPAKWSPLIQISNDSTFYDGDSFSIYASDDSSASPVFFALLLADHSGSAFNSISLPLALALGDFGTRAFEYRYTSGQPRMDAYGELSSLQLVPAPAVPEPAAWAILSAGLLLLAWRGLRGGARPNRITAGA